MQELTESDHEWMFDDLTLDWLTIVEVKRIKGDGRYEMEAMICEKMIEAKLYGLDNL